MRVRETGHMTLGVRRFTGPVPLRSRIGNDVTALLFRGATGWRLGDTQTGLRGYPAGRLTWLQEVPGDRYEYELSALLRAHAQFERRGLRCFLETAQHRADAGLEFAWAEGLGQVVVGAQLQPQHPVGFAAMGGEHDDRTARMLAQAP